MSDSISTTDVEIVDINQDINMKNMPIVINDNDNDNDDGSVAIQPINMLVIEDCKRIKEGESDEKEIESEAEGEEETTKTQKRNKGKARRRDINIIRDHVAENVTCCNTCRFRGCFIFFLLVESFFVKNIS